MPRAPRQFKVGKIYHILNRGVDTRKIFLNNQDYSRFLLSLEFFNAEKSIDIWNLIHPQSKGGSDPPLLAEMAKRINEKREEDSEPIVEIMAFALMPNHYHLVLKEITPDGISSFMKKIGGYSTYFNKQNNRSGSLFESRYKCIEIKNDAQLLVVFNYVHTNPVELVEPQWKEKKIKNFNQAKNFLENYQWSSYPYYINSEINSSVINKKFFIKFFRGEKNCKKEIENWIQFKASNYQNKGQFNYKDFE